MKQCLCFCHEFGGGGMHPNQRCKCNGGDGWDFLGELITSTNGRDKSVMTHTCANEGCGEPIEWKYYAWNNRSNWQHFYGSPSYGKHLAHPAGGTNATPPEELEISKHEWSRGMSGPHYKCKKCLTTITVSDENFPPPNGEECPGPPPEELEKKMTTLYEIQDMVANAIHVQRGGWWVPLRKLIQKMVEEARADERAKYYAEVAELRAQLDGALVPKFKVGERVLRKSSIVSVISGPKISYEIEYDDGSTGVWYEDELSPLPEEVKCKHRNKYGGLWEVSFWGGSRFKHCPDCGEPLTTGDGE